MKDALGIFKFLKVGRGFTNSLVTNFTIPRLLHLPGARKRGTSKHPVSLASLNWEVLNGVGVDGVGGIFPFFSFFFVFFRFSSLFRFFFVFLRFFSFFFVFLRFSSFFACSPGTRANDCNLLGKWGISLRPRLHRPRSELPD